MTHDWSPTETGVAWSDIVTTPRLLVALDFDGTASPLVDDPMAARALPEVRDAVERLVALPNTAVAYVSGRSLPDLREIAEHGDDSAVTLAGSHGAQYWFPGEGEVDILAAEDDDDVRAELWDAVQPIIDRHDGVELERKSFGLGVHGRRATPEAEAAAFDEIDAFMSERMPQWRRRRGNHILEFSSRVEGKDTAIGVLRERFDATGILFAGDDVTDEDALRVLGPGDFGVRVGPGETVASVRVRTPQEIGVLLNVLADDRASAQE